MFEIYVSNTDASLKMLLNHAKQLTQTIFTCLKSTMEALEQCVKYV